MPPEERKLLVFLVDGFSNYYLSDRIQDLPGIARMLKNGCQAEYLVPEFPTLTLPNFTAMFTGCHVDKHGIFSNMLYCGHKKIHFSMDHPHLHEPYWMETTPEPLWTTAQRQGVNTSIYWPWFVDEKSAHQRGSLDHHFEPFREYRRAEVEMHLPDRLRHMISQLQRPGSQYAVLYFDRLDDICHVYGPRSVEAYQELAFVDKMVTLIQREFEEREMNDKVDFLILSDHGHTESSAERMIIVDDYLDTSLVEMTAERGPILSVWPMKDCENKVYEQLRAIANVKVYRKAEIPDRLHCKNAKFAPPILVLGDPGYQLGVKNPAKRWQSSKDDDEAHINIGVHGYDNQLPEMRAICIGSGPHFKTNHTVGRAIRMVDLYLLMAKLVNVRPNPSDACEETVLELLR